MASTYSPYSDIQKVYNAKVAWNNATTDEERKRQNEIATSARKNLEAYGYGDVANQISASGADATAVRKIMDSYAPTPTTNTNKNTNKNKTYTDTELINKNNNEVNQKVNKLWGIQADDRDMMTGKYDKLEETAYSNPFETDEAKAILSKYDLSALKARDNAVASGGATNGGNIDSFAASNALRQQSALISQGHQVVLDSHSKRLDNVRGILSDLGVYLQNQDKGMQTTIGIQQQEGQRLFENDETAKNNDVARKTTISSVTGLVPNEWSYDNNIYLNSDGTVKDEFLTEEFDSTGGFTTIINNAKAKLATTTDPTERANLQATINAATQAKALKTFSSPKYSKYAHEVQGVTPTKTESARVADMNNDLALKTLDAETELAKLSATSKKTSTGSGGSGGGGGTKPTLTASQAATAIKNGEISQAVIDAYNYYYGTNYTVENPPNLNGAGFNDLGDDSDSGGGDGTNDKSEESKDIYTKWEDDGIVFKTFTVKGPADETKLASSGVDEHGKTAIQNVYTAVANGDLGINGTVSNYDLAEYLIIQSDNNNTNKNQLKKVFAYFGLDKNMLEQVTDSGFWFWQWGQGTNYK